jgi:hypothetical protein
LNRRGSANCMEAGASIKVIKVNLPKPETGGGSHKDTKTQSGFMFGFTGWKDKGRSWRIKVNQSDQSDLVCWSEGGRCSSTEYSPLFAPGLGFGRDSAICGAEGFGGVAIGGRGGVGGFPAGEADFVGCGDCSLAMLFDRLLGGFSDSGGEASDGSVGLGWAVDRLSLEDEAGAEARLLPGPPPAPLPIASVDADLLLRFPRRSSRRSRSISSWTFWISARRRAITPLVSFL